MNPRSCRLYLKTWLAVCAWLGCALFVLYVSKPGDLNSLDHSDHTSLIQQRQAELNRSQDAVRHMKTNRHENDDTSEHDHHQNHRDHQGNSGKNASVGRGVDLIDINNGRRFRTLTSDRGVFAYSSYYDRRDPPQIRVLVLIRQVYMNVSFFCSINTHSGGTYNSTGRFTIFPTYLPYKYDYISGVIKCSLPRQAPAGDLKDISIHPSLHDLQVVQYNLTIPLKHLKVRDHAIPILTPGASKKNSLTRCYAPLQRKYDRVNKIVWNIELSRILGADKFIFYNYSISPRTDAILRHYVAEGIAEVRPWNMHRPGKHVRQHTYYCAQMLAEHDCLLSEMFSAKYVLLADVDEIPFPPKDTSLVSMADRIFGYYGDEPGNDLGSLALRSRSVISNATLIAHFPVRKAKRAAVELGIEPLLHTYYFMPAVDCRKPLVIPERVDVLCVHNACFMQDGYREKTVHPEKEGVILHYRDKPRFFKDNSTVLEYTQVLMYSYELIRAVANKSKFITTSS